MSNQQDLAQLKLTNGSEIVCEVMEWPEEGSNQLIIRNAMTIINYEYDGGDRAYAFRSWIHFLEDDKDYVMMNCDHIITMNRPTPYLIDQYQLAVKESSEVSKNRLEEYERYKLEGLQRISASLKSLLDIKDPDNSSLVDSDKRSSNIIQFPSDDTIH
jgi:NDP-sugar pyrophosphorylase family protein